MFFLTHKSGWSRMAWKIEEPNSHRDSSFMEIWTDHLPCWAGLWCSGEPRDGRRQRDERLRGFCAGGQEGWMWILCATVHPALRDGISCWYFASSKALKEKPAAVQVSNSETQGRGSKESKANGWINHPTRPLSLVGQVPWPQQKK